jgi:hypothetical protein
MDVLRNAFKRPDGLRRLARKFYVLSSRFDLTFKDNRYPRAGGLCDGQPDWTQCLDTFGARHAAHARH